MMYKRKKKPQKIVVRKDVHADTISNIYDHAPYLRIWSVRICYLCVSMSHCVHISCQSFCLKFSFDKALINVNRQRKSYMMFTEIDKKLPC